ncbi:hypothetical protein KC19_7G055600 [Ceratodon purpureus]|uniref:F-box domain-containing protein n=1 Tax=Ceratodon purpureus TaxID=3225 RepID=A0A8T0H4X5_CERPU|nr:hypothetical protein KC19_7G055600 [Ceratodon purpureus]
MTIISKTLTFDPETPPSSSPWNKLPDPLIGMILSWLPTAEFIRSRTVCRRWNSLPETVDFRKIITSRTPWDNNSSPWFMLFSKTNAVVYNAYLNKWINLPVPVAAHKTLCWPVASDGGLVLYYNSKQKGFAVGNPILPRAWYELPPLWNVKCFEAAGLLVTNRDTCAYKIVIMGKNKALKDITESCGLVPPGCHPSNSNVVCCGTLYFWCDPDALVSFNMESRKWERVTTIMPDELEKQTLISQALIQCERRIFMIGACEEYSHREGVRVWILDVDNLSRTMQWVRYDEMPRELFKKFIGDGLSEILCVGCDDMCLLTTQAGTMILTYGIQDRKWDSVPDYRTFSRLPVNSFIDGIAFWPRIDASPHSQHTDSIPDAENIPHLAPPKPYHHEISRM